MANIAKIVNKVGTRIAANPEKTLTGLAASAVAVIEAAPVIIPTAVIGAAGYGIYRLVKAATK